MYADAEEEFLNTTPSPIKRPQFCDLSVVWKDKRDEKVYTYSPIKSEFSVKNPPFGLDMEIKDVEEVAQGYRKGGTKEARLFRVALLAAKKEVEHLHPVKVRNIPEDVTEEQLAEEFSKFGAIGDIYVPRDLKRFRAREFAVVRFEKEEAAKKALASQTLTLREIKAKRKAKQLELDRVSKQWSTFTSNSGVHGMTNEISEDMRHTEYLKSTKKLEFKQNITLEQCFSRSGCPWGSKAELRILEPHGTFEGKSTREVMGAHTIKLEGLNSSTSVKKLRAVFESYGPSLVDIYCPRSLGVNERNSMQHMAALRGSSWENEGIAYARYSDRRDYTRAVRDLQAGRIVIDDAVLSGDPVTPFQWPSDRTRRYW